MVEAMGAVDDTARAEIERLKKQVTELRHSSTRGVERRRAAEARYDTILAMHEGYKCTGRIKELEAENKTLHEIVAQDKHSDDQWDALDVRVAELEGLLREAQRYVEVQTIMFEGATQPELIEGYRHAVEICNRIRTALGQSSAGAP